MARKTWFKIRQKNYHLTNDKTGEKMVVFPPQWPGVNNDNVGRKDKKGHWIRRFQVVDPLGVEGYKKKDFIILAHKPKFAPIVKIKKQRWTIKLIG